MGCVYTPRGLKIRIGVEDAFVYLARVWGRFSAFSALRIVEDVVNAPGFFSWIVAVVTLGVGVGLIGSLCAMVVTRLVLAILQAKAVVISQTIIAPLWRVVRPFSFLTGRGFFVLVLAAFSYFRGGWIWTFSVLVIWFVAELCDHIIVSPEIAFVEALMYMARKCNVAMPLRIDAWERSNGKWAFCYAELAQNFPVVTNRFVLDDDFQSRFCECINNYGKDDDAKADNASKQSENTFAFQVCTRIEEAVCKLIDGDQNDIGRTVIDILRTKSGRSAIRGAMLDIVEFVYKNTFGENQFQRISAELNTAAARVWDEKSIEFKHSVNQMYKDFDYTAQIESSSSYLIPRCMTCEACLSIAFFEDKPDEAEFARFRYRFEEVAQEMYSDVYDILDEAGYIEHESRPLSSTVEKQNPELTNPPSLFDDLALFEPPKKIVKRSERISGFKKAGITDDH